MIFRGQDGVAERGLPAFIGKLSTVGFWKRQARTWHWMSGAVCLIGMLLFAFTGITLNHAQQIPARPVVSESEFQLSERSLAAISPDIVLDVDAAVPLEVIREVRRELKVDLSGRPGEWTDVDVYISLPRPGGDAWLTIDRETGGVFYEETSRGPVAYLNDLHKGRSTGPVWSLFLDVFAVACMIFCLTGLWLLQIHAMKRASTWPLVGAGIGIPVLLLLFLVHM